MSWTKRQNDRVFCRGSLQLKIERAAETFAQSQPPSPIQTAAKRRMNHDVRAAVLIKEALGNDVFLRRHDAERQLSQSEILNNLCGGGVSESNFIREPIQAGTADVLVRIAQFSLNLF